MTVDCGREFKPDGVSSLEWAALPRWKRDIARWSTPAAMAARQRELEEDICEFRKAYPLVDLEAVPRVRGLWTPGQKCGACSDREARHNARECQFRHRARLFTRQAGRCGWCSEALNPNLSGADIDHVIPVSRRGPWAEWNYQLLHAGCNRSKGALLADRAYDLAAAHGFVIPDFIAVWEQPVRCLTFGRRTRQVDPGRWRPASGPVHLVHPGDEDKTLCRYGCAGEWPRVSGDGGKPWNVTCDHCRERRLILGPGLGPAHPALPY